MPIPDKSERTLRMKEEFITLHSQGWSLKRIAYHFDLDSSTVYRHLQDIADAAGVTRESLLDIPRAKHVTHERSFAPVAPVDLTNFRQNFQQALKDFDHIITTIATHIAASEQDAQQIAKEEAQWQ